MFGREENEAAVPPYVAYRTFKSFIAWLEEGIPDRIDRSFWGERLSGSNGIQTMTALRVLGLINEENRPTMTLERLVKSEGEDRKNILRDVLQQTYYPIFQLPLATATQAQLKEAFKGYTTRDAVLGKCMAFFVQAAQDADIVLSPHILKGKRTAGTPRKRGTRTTRRATRETNAPAAPVVQAQRTNSRGAVRTVRLASGGEVSLSVDVDLFELSEFDRSFVVRLVDEIRKYASESGQNET